MVLSCTVMGACARYVWRGEDGCNVLKLADGFGEAGFEDVHTLIDESHRSRSAAAGSG